MTSFDFFFPFLNSSNGQYCEEHNDVIESLICCDCLINPSFTFTLTALSHLLWPHQIQIFPSLFAQLLHRTHPTQLATATIVDLKESPTAEVQPSLMETTEDAVEISDSVEAATRDSDAV